jgi:hypothetical protein
LTAASVSSAVWAKSREGTRKRKETNVMHPAVRLIRRSSFLIGSVFTVSIDDTNSFEAEPLTRVETAEP